jgi:hypothetical protein
VEVLVDYLMDDDFTEEQKEIEHLRIVVLKLLGDKRDVQRVVLTMLNYFEFMADDIPQWVIDDIVTPAREVLKK